MSVGTSSSAALVCFNCGQALPAEAARCVHCGALQSEPATTVSGLARQGLSQHGGPSLVPPDVRIAALGTAFAGTPAGIGVRLAAFTIDAVVVAVVGVGIQLLLRSAAITAVVTIELIVGLVVLQARTGLGPGNALLRLRVARVDRPFSPGIGRSSVRSLITAAGVAVAGVGAWFVELTAGFDATGRHRSWGDLAAGTVVVALPSRAGRAPLDGPPPASPDALNTVRMPAPDPYAPPVAAVAVPARASAPVPPSVRGAAVAEHSSAAPAPAPSQQPPPVAPGPPEPRRITLPGAATVEAAGGVPPLPSVPVQSVPAQPVPAQPVPVQSVPDDVERTEVAGGLASVLRPGGQDEPDGVGDALLTFDTGQREQLPIPVVALLGRHPVGTEPTDVLITVRDHESTVSKTHVRLELTRAGTWVTDDSSTNGTDLLDEDGTASRLAPGVRTFVEDGTRVRLGNRVFTISTLMEDAS